MGGSKRSAPRNDADLTGPITAATPAQSRIEHSLSGDSPVTHR
ncbi:hypothetical protein SSAG_01009 [Streptomyces sp. Mg1]|nr:hypothetical protein SSAG_01009 [Streptomyces sp. Mg1]